MSGKLTRNKEKCESGSRAHLTNSDSSILSASGATIHRRKDRKPMSLKRHAGTLGIALLLSSSLYPCNIVVIGGYAPTAVRQVSGAVVGSGRIDLMGHDHDKERHSLTVPGARISVKTRTDTAFFKKDEVQYPPGVKPPTGNLKEWQCGSEVSAATTDEAGNFTISRLKPGKYCLDITGPQPENDNECVSHVVAGTRVCIPLNASFLIDLIPSAPKATLIADISQQWPDCSGGSFLTLRAHE